MKKKKIVKFLPVLDNRENPCTDDITKILTEFGLFVETCPWDDADIIGLWISNYKLTEKELTAIDNEKRFGLVR